MADKDPVSQYLAQIGRKGAEKRNQKLTPQRRTRIAKKAAAAGWKKAKKAAK